MVQPLLPLCTEPILAVPPPTTTKALQHKADTQTRQQTVLETACLDRAQASEQMHHILRGQQKPKASTEHKALPYAGMFSVSAQPKKQQQQVGTSE